MARKKVPVEVFNLLYIVTTIIKVTAILLAYNWFGFKVALTFLLFQFASFLDAILVKHQDDNDESYSSEDNE